MREQRVDLAGIGGEVGLGQHLAAVVTGTAIGLAATGNSVTASNAGAIDAQFDGAGGNAYGAMISTAGDVTFTNSGSVAHSRPPRATKK